MPHLTTTHRYTVRCEECNGTGKDKDGNQVKFLSAIITLAPKSIAEIWAAVFPEGNNDLDTATAVLDSFKVAKQ